MAGTPRPHLLLDRPERQPAHDVPLHHQRPRHDGQRDRRLIIVAAAAAAAASGPLLGEPVAVSLLVDRIKLQKEGQSVKVSQTAPTLQVSGCFYHAWADLRPRPCPDVQERLPPGAEADTAT